MQITIKNKDSLIIANFIFFNIIYLLCAYIQFGDIRLLPTSDIEHKIPFVSHALWPYIFIQSFSYSILIRSKNLLFIKRWFITSLLFTLICAFIYQVFPVMMNHENTFILLSESRANLVLFRLRDFGTTLNSFPALFIGIAFISSFLKFSDSKKIGILCILAAIIFSICALLIKQVYLSAIIASILITLFLSVITIKFVKE